MRPSVIRGNKKKTVEPVIIITENKFTPRISERTIKKREEARERRLKGSKYASGLDLCGIICLYVFLVQVVIIGAGGIGVCGYYLTTNTDTIGWKIAGIAMGAVTCIIGFILILLTILKQTRNRPWRYKKQEKTYDFYRDSDDDSDDDMQTIVENYDENQAGNSTIHRGSPEYGQNVSQSLGIQSPSYGKSREIALSPIPDPFGQFPPMKPDQIIFCPGCNRTHPSSHQCMYSTRIANGFSTQFRPVVHAPPQDTIAIQTEDNGQKPKTPVPHTAIDRTVKYSNTIQTQTDVSANPRSNITESIILRRVPIPTAKVVVQQPTTKVMIVKVPNVAGKLVIQPKPEPGESILQNTNNRNSSP